MDRSWADLGAPSRHPKRPKIGPRRLQDDLQHHLFSSSFLSSILAPLGSHFGLILAPLWLPKGRQSPQIVGLKTTLNGPRPPKTAQDGPKTLQDPSKTAQEPPKTPQRPPTRPKNDPRHTQNDQKSTQDIDPRH